MRIHWLKLNCQEQKEQKNTKGQLVSKRPFWCLQIFQKTNKFFSRISTLACKKRSNKERLGHFIPLIGGFYFDSLTLLFYLTSS